VGKQVTQRAEPFSMLQNPAAAAHFSARSLFAEAGQRIQGMKAANGRA